MIFEGSGAISCLCKQDQISGLGDRDSGASVECLLPTVGSSVAACDAPTQFLTRFYDRGWGRGLFLDTAMSGR